MARYSVRRSWSSIGEGGRTSILLTTELTPETLFAVHPVGEIVEHGIVRQHDQHVAHFFLQFLLRLGLVLVLGLVERRRRSVGCHSQLGRHEHRYEQGPKFLFHILLLGRAEPLLMVRFKRHPLWCASI